MILWVPPIQTGTTGKRSLTDRIAGPRLNGRSAWPSPRPPSGKATMMRPPEAIYRRQDRSVSRNPRTPNRFTGIKVNSIAKTLRRKRFLKK
jgi:hypothetical protein